MNIVSTGKFIGNYGEFRKYSSIFIETGSCYGRSIQLAIDAGYNWIKSVEAKQEFYEHCKNLFITNNGIEKSLVELYLGKSVDKLPDMLLDVDRPAVFWLDAHVSGEQSAGYQDWVEKQGESDYDQHKVLKAELHIVLKHRKDHILLIDDQNGLNDMNKEYMEIISSYNPDYQYYFFDELMGTTHYKDKILVCIPQ